MTKQYDRDYFDTWYRKKGINRQKTLARKVAMAVAVAEYHLMRPIISVLDVGCGEGAWRKPLLKLRPKLDYMGLDPSEYVVQRYGRRRNLRQAAFGDLASLRFDTAFDMIVCSDVLHYVHDAELRRGLSGFRDLCHGLAFIEVYCTEDDVEGDMHDFQSRPAGWYRRAFDRAGLTACGNHCYLTPRYRADAAALEICPPGRSRIRS